MSAPRKFGSGKATRPDHITNQWRLEAVRLRETAFTQRQKLNTAHSLVVKAIELLDAGQPENARLHLLDALRFLITDDEQKGSR